MITSGLYYPPSNTKADVRHGNSARTQKGEKGGEKRGWVWVGKKKNQTERKNLCCYSVTNCWFLASSPQWKAEQGCRGQDQELKAALLCFGAPD